MTGLPLPGAVLAKAARNRVLRPATPPPIGGWNARDLLTALPPDQAPVLVNLFPEADRVSLRDGYALHATLAAGPCVTMIPYELGVYSVLFAATPNTIWDVTSGTATVSLAGLASGDWIHTKMSGSVVLANGIDAPRYYDGTSWNICALTVEDGQAGSLSGVHGHNERLYWWADGSGDFWYGGVGSVQGALTKFPLSRLGALKGTVQAIGTWTVDAGNGVQDILVIVMTSGQIVLYEGSNPGDAYNWRIAGRYDGAVPLGSRCLLNVGAELVVLTTQGYLALTSVLRQGQIATRGAFSDAIQPEIVKASAAFPPALHPGWNAVLDPAGRLALVNHPVKGGRFEQHVISTQKGAWTLFRDLPARCWGAYAGGLYFGTQDGKVHRFAAGALSDDGSNITATDWFGWSPLGISGAKNVKAVRPRFVVDGTLTYRMTMLADFRESGWTVADSIQNVTLEAEGPDDYGWDSTYWAARSGAGDFEMSSAWGDLIQVRIVLSTKDQRVDLLGMDWLVESASRVP